MAYHHLALAARDMAAIHHFYETVMGFELVKVEVAPLPEGGGAKLVEFCLTTGTFSAEDRVRAVAALTADGIDSSKPQPRVEVHRSRPR